MRRTGLAVLFVSVLILAAASMGYAQSAEDLAKGQNAGVRYDCITGQDGSGRPWIDTVYIRGDEVTYTQFQPDGSELPLGEVRVTNKRTEGNKLILETTPPFANVPGPGIITIDGYRLTFHPMFNEGEVFNRK